MSEFGNFVNQLPLSVAIYNLQTGQYLFVSKEIEALIGYKPEEITEKGLAFVNSLIHPDDIEELQAQNIKEAEYIQKHPEIIKSYWADFKYRLKHIDGHWVKVHTRGRAYSLDKNNQVKEIINFTFDDSVANEVNFKELGKIALHSFDFFTEKLVHDLKGHIHVLEFVIEELVNSSKEIENLSGDEIRERLHSQSLMLTEVSSKLSNLMTNLKS